MSRGRPATVHTNINVYAQQSQRFRDRFGPSTSLLAGTRMIDYPTPPRTQSPATSTSSSSAPTTPSQGRGLVTCPFASGLADAYSTASSSSYLTATAIGDWLMPLSMCGNPYEEDPGMDLLPTPTGAISRASLDAIAFYTSPAVSTSGSMPTTSTNINFALAQHHNPVMLHSNFHGERYPRIKQEGDGESWFHDHIDMERSENNIDLSLYEQMGSPNVSASHDSSAGMIASPGIGFAALSPVSGAQSQQFESSPAARSESVESLTTFQQLGSSGASVHGQRNSANSERRYVCSVCGRAFDKKYNLREHEKKHDPSRVSPHVCPEPGCGKRLGRRTDVNRHVQSVHEKAKRFVCPKCLKRFDRKDTLSRYAGL
jgi:transposase-like protein